MGKLNLKNISAGLNSVKSITENLDTLSHSENVPTELIFPADENPYARDDTPESLSALAESIWTNGLIHPLAVNKISQDEYRLISGERRYKAITEHLHWKTIPCMVYDHISQNSAQLKLHAANLEVRDYTTEQKLRFYEETNRLLRSMKESGEYTGPIQKGIAELLGVSERQVRRYKTVTETLPKEQQERIIAGQISIDRACKIANSKPASGIVDCDRSFWDERILSALKFHYNAKEIFLYYLFQVPTTSEAAKEKLKPACGFSDGTVKFADGTWGDLTARSQKVTIQCGKKALELPYSQIDAIIRQAIREGKWMNPEEAASAVKQYLDHSRKGVGK